jgi:hypothetical protein
MTVNTADGSADAGRTTEVTSRYIVPAARARNGQWLLAALLLAGAAQLIAVAVVTSADRIASPAPWWAVLLATAPAPLSAVAAFAPRIIGRVAVVLAVAAVLVGLIGGVTHNGLFFAPALVALVIGGLRLWRLS